MRPPLHTDHKGNKYFLAEIKMDKIVNSRYNPREMKSSHKNELKKSMEDRGNLVPIIGYMSEEDYARSVEDVMYLEDEE